MVNNIKVIFVLILFSVISCSKNATDSSDFLFLNQPSTSEKNNTVLSTEKTKVGISEIKDVGESSLTRNSDSKDKNGWATPPFNFAYLEFPLKNAPYNNEKVTIVPKAINIEAFQIQISKISKKNAVCPGGSLSNPIWLIESEKVIDKRILEIQPLKNYNPNNPFGVFVIYPAIDYAKGIDKALLTKMNLPKNVSLKRIESAIDIDKDSKPDLLSVTFCCGESQESSKHCPYLCYKYYKKIREKWVIFSFDGSERCAE